MNCAINNFLMTKLKVVLILKEIFGFFIDGSLLNGVAS